MSAASDQLWWLNNVYRSRLTHAERCLGLLENLLAHRAPHADSDLDTIRRQLHDLRQHLIWLAEEHRAWRYAYYYQPLADKRMVADEPDVHRALAHFRRMRARHERVFSEALSAFAALPHPGPAFTQVALGDLWQHVEGALDELAHFIDTAAHLDGGA